MLLFLALIPVEALCFQSTFSPTMIDGARRPRIGGRLRNAAAAHFTEAKADEACDDMKDVNRREQCTIKNLILLEQELHDTHDCAAIIPLKHFMERMSGRSVPTFCD